MCQFTTDFLKLYQEKLGQRYKYYLEVLLQVDTMTSPGESNWMRVIGKLEVGEVTSSTI